MDETPTTRRYPRTLYGVDSAFPNTAPAAHAFWLDNRLRARFMRWLRAVFTKEKPL